MPVPIVIACRAKTFQPINLSSLLSGVVQSGRASTTPQEHQRTPWHEPRRAAFLDAVFTYSPDVVLQRHFVAIPNGWEKGNSTLLFSKGLAYERKTDSLAANLIVLSNGTNRLRNVLEHLAGELKMDPRQLEEALCGLVRALTVQGLLIRARGANAPKE